MRVFDWALLGFFALSASGCPKRTHTPEHPPLKPCWTEISTDRFQLTAEVQKDLDERLTKPPHAFVRKCEHAWADAVSGSCSDQVDQACDEACPEDLDRCKKDQRTDLDRACLEAVVPKFIETMKHCEGWTLDDHNDLKPPAS